jgi:hypothetical protein
MARHAFPGPGAPRGSLGPCTHGRGHERPARLRVSSHTRRVSPGHTRAGMAVTGLRLEGSRVLQNITYVINPRGATIFPKGHTSWDTLLHMYINITPASIKEQLSFSVSLSLYFNSECPIGRCRRSRVSAVHLLPPSIFLLGTSLFVFFYSYKETVFFTRASAS